jgi:DNA-binding FrmR family transcriptional regulator
MREQRHVARVKCSRPLDGIIAEVIEDHIMEHLVDPSAKQGDARSQAAEELVEIIHSYLT